MGNQAEIESLLHKLAETYPKDPAFRRQLVKYYVAQKRVDDAEKEVRTIASANPADVESALDVVRFLHMFKGPAAAKQELATRVRAGGDVYRYRLTLAELSLAEGDIDASIKLLDELAKTESSDDRILQVKTKLAEAYLRRRDLEATDKLAAEILSKDGRDGNGLRLRANVLLERGKYDEATANLRQALSDQPKSLGLMMLQANVYERSGAIELADRQYTDALRVADFDPAVGLNYIAFLRRRGNSAQAEEVATQLVSKSPRNPQVLAILADLKLARQDWSGAQEIADTLRSVSSDQSGADQILAAALSGQRKYDESINILQAAYAAQPSATPPMRALVDTLMRAQKSDQAKAFLQTVIDKDPTNADALTLLASVQLATNEQDKALANLKAAVERQPKSLVGYRALANLYLQGDNVDEATKVIADGLQVQPGNVALRLTMAGILERKGQFEKAIQEYEDILKQETGSMIVANNLASLLSDHRTDAASLDRAYSLAVGLTKSQVPQFKDTLGWIHYKRRDYGAAAPLLEEAVAQLPDIALARYHLGMTYVAMGDTAKASEQLGKGLQLAPADGDLKEKIQTALQQLGKS
jgi:tetratricopeptide (TPR) repeat protein